MILLSRQWYLFFGVPDIQKFVPLKCFIDGRDFDSIDELARYLIDFSKEEYDQFLEERQSFLQSKNFRDFTSLEFVKRITNICMKDGL